MNYIDEAIAKAEEFIDNNEYVTETFLEEIEEMKGTDTIIIATDINEYRMEKEEINNNYVYTFDFQDGSNKARNEDLIELARLVYTYIVILKKELICRVYEA